MELKVRGIGRCRERRLVGDDVVGDEIHEVLVERLHTVLLAGILDVIVQRRRPIPIANQVPGGSGREQDLERRCPAVAIRARRMRQGRRRGS